MIGYLEGKLLKKENDRILLLANQVGYEVMLPAFVMETIRHKAIGENLSLTIYYHQTERQPRPILIGFHLEAEKEFFQQFISVEAIGPLKAVKALTIPIREIARAIESRDVASLSRLKGIGERTAKKIVAALQGKMDKYALIRKEEAAPEVIEDFTKPIYEVLVMQLGHKSLDARRMIKEALARNSTISTPEALFDEVYRGEKNQ
ncbi:MAG: Holliday junction branch migration protein RuvA [Desulfobacterales bacterium]